MISKELLQKIRQIEIHTKRLVSGSLIGDTTSAQKGTGLEFDQIREYQMGDDVRFIDWKSSARMNKILVKQYFEERNRVIMLLVDGSSSSFFSSGRKLKYEVMAEVASVLALVATYGKDHVGLIIFSDEVEVFIPPTVGRHHAHKIMEKLFLYEAKKKSTTNISSALEYLSRLHIKDAIAFVISDFIAEGFEKSMAILSRKHDLIAIRCLDKNEERLGRIGLLDVQDLETGKVCSLDLRRRQQKKLNNFLGKRITEQNSQFKKYGIDLLQITPGKPFMGEIVRFFRRRMMY